MIKLGNSYAIPGCLIDRLIYGGHSVEQREIISILNTSLPRGSVVVQFLSPE